MSYLNGGNSKVQILLCAFFPVSSRECLLRHRPTLSDHHFWVLSFPLSMIHLNQDEGTLVEFLEGGLEWAASHDKLINGGRRRRQFTS